MRVYLAATGERLRALVSEGVAVGDWEGFAADEAAHAAFGDADDEELEYALSVAAGEASAAMAGEPGASGRRFVVVAEIAGSAVTSDLDTPGAVFVHGPVQLTEVAAVLASGWGERRDVDGVDDLGWYGVQELPDLLA